jgi:hypothetical protein
VREHLGRQSGVQKVEVSLRDGKVEITPKEDGQIDPAQLLKAVYDSGVSVAEMVLTARGRVVKDSSGGLALQVAANQSFAIAANELSRGLESLAGTEMQVTLRGLLYKKPPGKKKGEPSGPMKLLILEVQKKE